jgi:hypothetical protein
MAPSTTYLGFAPLEIIKKTLTKTTQMAKMIIRAPLRCHIKSRLSFMQARRLEETVSTDPMFANCRSLGHGYTGAQVFYRVLHQNLDPKQLQPYLGYAPLEIIKKTSTKTTQMAKMIIRAPLRRHIKSCLSFMQAGHLEETVSTDPMFANCRSLGHGYTGAQVFYGLKSTQIDVYGFRSKGEFPQRHRDFIWDHDSPSALRRDNAKEEKSEEVDQIHRKLFIKDHFCEPYNPSRILWNHVESSISRITCMYFLTEPELLKLCASMQPSTSLEYTLFYQIQSYLTT